MPLSNKDLQYMDVGAYSSQSQKLYTNGDIVNVGMYVLDPDSQQEYKVTQELSHGPIHPMKRYLLERKEAADLP